MKKACLTAGLLAISVAWSAGLPRDRFAIGTYCLNDASQTEAHIRDLKDCGIDFVVGVSGTKSETRELMKKYGILEIVGGYIPHPPGTPKAGTFEQSTPLEKFDEGCRQFIGDLKAGKFPTFAALSLGDEPNARDFPHLGKTIARTRQATGGIPLYLNLFPNYASSTLNNTNPRYPQSQLGAATYADYIDEYCKYIPLDHICWDHYVYSYTREVGIARFYDNFRIVADACRRTGKTLRFVPQVNSQKPEMWLSANMLRFQGFVTMAFGGESVAWACWTKGWWHNLVLTTSGEKTEQYEKLKRVNHELKTVGTDYMRFRNVATHFVGFAPDDTDLKDLPVKPLKALDAGHVNGLEAVDGRQLLVGEMTSRTEGSDAKAFLIVAADDPFDTAPAIRTIRFDLTEGLGATVIGGDGKVALTSDVQGRLCLPLASSSGVLLVVAPRSGARQTGCTSYPKDQLDTSMSVLKCLDKVERAVLCHEGDGSLDRIAVLRLLGALDMQVIGQPEDYPSRSSTWKQYGPYHDLVGGLPKWMTDGMPGDGRQKFSLVANAAVARLYALAGVLYGIPAYREKGLRNGAWVRSRNGGEDVPFRDETNVPEMVRAYDRLMCACRKDLRQTVRQGGEMDRPFWNGHSPVFAYPPAFDFPEIAGATKYVFRVVDDALRTHSFEATSPKVALSPVWEMVQAGLTTVECCGVGEGGRDLGLSGRRKFWRQATFDPVDYSPAKRSYSAAVDRTLDYLYDWPDIEYLVQHGEPNVALGNNFVSYPSKMLSAVIRVMVKIAEKDPSRRERALKTARIAADYLLATAEKDGSPLAGFTQTYCGKGQLSGTYAGQHMLVYPANVGSAFLCLHAATGDAKYLRAAVRIGRKYLELQGEDGAWFLKMQAKDGSPVSSNRLQPTSVLPFLEELHAVTKDDSYQRAADRAFVSLDKGPLVDWDWSGQFEDIAPSKERYQNQTKHMACETAMYILKRFPGDSRRLAQARDILRFAEDQFVFWKKPCRADGTGFWMPIYPFFAWRCPAVVEQYSCYSPIDSSAAKLIRTYLALYKAEGNPLDLAKARALGDAMVNEQDDNGRIRTYWIPEPGDADALGGAVRIPRGGDWYNCMVSDVEALALLDEACAKARPVRRMDRGRLQVGTYSLSRKAETDAHVRDMRDCGIDFVIGPRVSNRSFLDACARHGLGVVVSGAVDGWWGGYGKNAGTMSSQRPLSGYEARLAAFATRLDHPAIWLIDIGDEPSALDFPHYGKVASTVDAAAPQCPSYLNVYPNYGILAEATPDQRREQLGTTNYEEYVTNYCRHMPLDYFCFDYYPFYDDPSRTREMTAGLQACLRTASTACRSTNRSLWYVAQVNSRPDNVRTLTENQLRYQAFSALAYGAEVVTWACWSPGWWTNNVLTASGDRTVQYDRLKVVNAELHGLGPSFMSFKNVATHFVGSGREVSSLDAAGVIGLAADDGSPLVVGEMVSRTCGDCEKALLVFAAGDPTDEKRASHTIRFRSDVPFSVSWPRGISTSGDGACSFQLKDNACVLLTMRFRAVSK